MPDRTRPPFRAEHIGSLKRTPELLQARANLEDGKISREDLAQVESKAIKQAIDLQKRLGYKGLTDGEYRRKIFFGGFFEGLEGIEITPGLPDSTIRSFFPNYFKDISGQTSLSFPLVVAKLKRAKPIYLPEFLATKSLVDAAEVPNIKITLACPFWYDFRLGKKWIKEGCDAYESRADLLNDLTAIYRAELADLYAAGCRNVQIDEPGLTHLCIEDVVNGFKVTEGIDAFALLDEYIEMLNACLRDVPKDMTTGIHLCRGNFRGRSLFAGGYDPIAKQLFSKLNVDCFYLEYHSEIAGGFEPLVHLPRGKIAILGLVSTKTPELESPEHLVSRIEAAAQIIHEAHPERTREEVLDQLCLSPQCGFAGEVVGTPNTMEEMEKKMKLVVDVARRVWNY